MSNKRNIRELCPSLSVSFLEEVLQKLVAVRRDKTGRFEKGKR
ncbi:hypothetical protein ACEXAJ_06980 [Fusobacterium necrophorum subsp. funduliforme]